MPLLSVTSVITGGSESATTPAAVVAVADSVLELTSVAPLRAVIEADAIDKSPATALVPPATVVVLLASVVVPAVVDSALVDSAVVSLIVVPTVVVGLSVVVVVVAVLGV